MICNTQIDTAMYELIPAPTGKCGRSRKYGERKHAKKYFHNILIGSNLDKVLNCFLY